MSNWDKVIATQTQLTEQLFRLAPGEEATRRQFEQLIMDTNLALKVAGRHAYVFRLDSIPGDLVSQFREAVPDLIQRDWKRWHQTYQALKARHPVLELCEMMHEIGETDQFNSWPYYQEEAIQDWIDGGDISAMPFQDCKGIITESFYEHLRELRKKIGGWVYWRDSENGVIFLGEKEWQKLRLESKPTGYLAGRGNRFSVKQS
jgi:hypothetical protein